ncbi:hypothetical protein [Ghiorsea bivora]|uniref:hypothetical protein n=1 Tax=Ghiorsea bivora TaxID=1485545 RepID=UPI00057138C4|nr:hypothetical protein [Ghiorsea bivora]
MMDGIQQSISEQQRALVQDMFVHGVTQAESVFEAMVAQPMQVAVDAVQVIDVPRLQQQVAENYDVHLSWVFMRFTGLVSGSVAILFPSDSITVLINTLTQSTMRSYEMDIFRMGAITEVGNILMNGVIGKLCDTKQGEVSFDFPDYEELSADDCLSVGQQGSVVMTANVHFCVSGLYLSSLLMLQIEQESLTSFFSALEAGGVE